MDKIKCCILLTVKEKSKLELISNEKRIPRSRILGELIKRAYRKRVK